MREVDPVQVYEILEEVDRGFRLEDHINLTQVRRSSWIDILRERGKLQLSDRADTVAVVVTPEIWRGVEELVDLVHALVEQMEQREIEELWLERVNTDRKPADVAGMELLAVLKEQEAQ